MSFYKCLGKLLNSKKDGLKLVKEFKIAKQNKGSGPEYHNKFTQNLESLLNQHLPSWKTISMLKPDYVKCKKKKKSYEVDILGEYLGIKGKELWAIEVKTGKHKIKEKVHATTQLKRIKKYLKEKYYLKENYKYHTIKTFFSHPTSPGNEDYKNLPLEEIIIGVKYLSKNEKFLGRNYFSKY